MPKRLTTPKSPLVFVLLTGLILSSASSSWGGVKEALGGVKEAVTVRRVLGLAFLGGGVALAMKGFEYHDDADGLYDAYQAAKDPVEIDRLYQRATNRDVKSQVSWALAGAFAISGVRLLLTGHSGKGKRPDYRRQRPTAQKMSKFDRLVIQPRLRQHREIGIELKKPIF